MFLNGRSESCPEFSGTSSDSQKCRSDMVATAPSAMERHWDGAIVSRYPVEIGNTLEPHDLRTKICVAVALAINKGGVEKKHFSWTRTPLWSFFGWLVNIHCLDLPTLLNLMNPCWMSECVPRACEQANLNLKSCNLDMQSTLSKKNSGSERCVLVAKMPWCLSNLIHLTTQCLTVLFPLHQ